MSDAYAGETTLVSEGSNVYDRALDVAIATTIVSFLLGIVTLVRLVELDATGASVTTLVGTLLALTIGGVGTVGALSALGILPITSQRARGIGIGLLVSLVLLTAIAVLVPVTLQTLLGIGLLAQAGTVLAAGVVSRLELVDTDPSATPGLLAGLAFALVGLLIGAAVGSALVPGGPLVTYATALVAAVGLLGTTVLPREDIGSALPVAILVGVLGLVITTGTIGPGWSWSPGADIDGELTGVILVPLFVLTGSIVASWGAAKSRAGYGAVGRQYGAYLVVYLNALLMVAIMLSIVAFVLLKGFTYAVHGIQIGALSALVVLTPLLVVVVDWARTPAGTTDWHSGARQVVRVIPVAALGGVALLLAVVQVTGSALDAPFTYTVWVNRSPKVLETAATITTDPTVGTLLVVLAGTLVAWYFLRKYGSLRSVGEQSERVVAVERWIGITVGVVAVLAVVFTVAGTAPLGVPLGSTVGLGIVVGAALSAVGLAGWAFVSLSRADSGIAAGGLAHAQSVRVGIFGGLALAVAAVILEPFAGVNPSVAGFDIVPFAAFGGAAAAGGVALATAWAARQGVEATTERVLQRESALGVVGLAGFAVVAALHVALTGVPVTVGGVTIGDTGTLSWPMLMEAYIPLGAEPGGIMPAVVGTIWLVVGASLFAVPLGVGAAVFLTEYAEQGKFTAVVEIATNSLWSTPSVVFGLFGAAFLIPRLGGDESLLTGMLVLGFMLLPLVLITSREAIKSVPDEYRDASAALGVSQWETIKTVVLPAAMPGVITGVILGVGRIAGETAPLILVLGSTLNATEAIDVLGGFRFVGQPPFVENPTLLEAAAALPTQVWAVIAAGVSGSPSMGWASALVLLMVVLSFYAVGIAARTYFRRKLNYE